MDRTETHADVLREVRRERLVELASTICDVHSPTGAEGAVAALLASLMQQLGMRTTLQEVEDERFNVVGVLDGTGGGKTLMFNGHLDTSFPFLLGISADSGLLEAPLPSVVEGEWLFGTGIDNMKAAFACYLGAVEALQRVGKRPAGDIVITGVVGEIEASPVARYQGRSYRGHGHGTRYLIGHGALADFCVLGEPSNLRIGVGSCGTVWVRITTHGPVTGSYVSDWESNAIHHAIRMMEALQSWRSGFIERYRHPAIDPKVTISAIEGGWPWRAARSPGDCSIYVDVRTAPDQPLITVRDELTALVRSVDGINPRRPTEVEFYATIPGFEISPEVEIVQAVQRASTAILGEPAPYSYSPAVDDGSHLVRYGIPTVVYGPGGARRDEPGGPRNEYVRISNLVDCTKVYALTALDICNQPNATPIT